MVDVASFKHPCGDRVLSSLAMLEGPLSGLVRSFPGSVLLSGSEWLNYFFERRIRSYLEDPSLKYEGTNIGGSFYDSLAIGGVVHKAVTLSSLQPHYFRGFRELKQPIILNDNLVVIDGRNSSGKTSLAEALEWLFTGRLARRETLSFGNPKELENCIGNGFRSLTEKTWVEAEFLVDGTKKMTLRRVLTSDYGGTLGSVCSSLLFHDGTQLTQVEEANLLDELFGMVPPLLMQHTLRSFVQTTPTNRHKYFERLLQLDELTTLIEKTALGEKRLQEFHSPSGNAGLLLWTSLKSICKDVSKPILRKAERGNVEEMRTKVNSALMQVTQYEFPELVVNATNIQDAYRLISDSLSQRRQETFPLLKILSPRQTIDEVTKEAFARCASTDSYLEALEKEISNYESVKKTAELIDSSKIAISKALAELEKAGVLNKSEKSRMCPLCNYSEIDTLTIERINEIDSWVPTINTLMSAKGKLNQIIESIKMTFAEVERIGFLLIPPNPVESEWLTQGMVSNDATSELVASLRSSLLEANTALENASSKGQAIKTLNDNIKLSEVDSLRPLLRETALLFSRVLKCAEQYSLLFSRLDQTIGSIAKEDSDYNLLSTWINCVTESENILKDLQWELAKKHANEELESIRNELIDVRQKLLESQRNSFNSGITSLWQSLRCDSYSSFSQLFIPEPHGKGYPIEIEVKARIDDGNSVHEVDVLKVFSESQVNALGVAAFVTRSKIIGHKMLIFDDPVQSMDEDHFKTFATSVVSGLLSSGFQVIILTHNDIFAREISYAHHDLATYLTMSIRHSKKEGCQVEDGNRRVYERIRKAEKLAEEGKLGDAWKSVRLSLERLYTVVYKKYGPKSFNPLSWIDQTAEYMWDDGTGKGAGKIIEEKIPGVGKRLKEILDMTAGGTHDKQPHGNTDLMNATRDLKQLLTKLQVGG